MTKKFCDICGMELNEEDRVIHKWSWTIVEAHRFRDTTIQHEPFVMDFCEPCFKNFKDTIRDLVTKEDDND